MATEEMYKELILDLYRHPLNKKVLADFDVEHREFNPTCGDDVTIQIKFDEEGRVADIGHQGVGCAISQAAVSLLTDDVKGKKKEDIKNITEDGMMKLLGFEVVYARRKCALLGLYTLQRSLVTQAFRPDVKPEGLSYSDYVN